MKAKAVLITVTVLLSPQTGLVSKPTFGMFDVGLESRSCVYYYYYYRGPPAAISCSYRDTGVHACSVARPAV